MKNVQIPQELFFDLVRYFMLGDTSEERFKAVLTALEDKVDKIAKHETYTLSKTAETEAEREKARQQYLDMVGMNQNFRYEKRV